MTTEAGGWPLDAAGHDASVPDHGFAWVPLLPQNAPRGAQSPGSRQFCDHLGAQTYSLRPFWLFPTELPWIHLESHASVQPKLEREGWQDYVEREVLPFVPEAWVDGCVTTPIAAAFRFPSEPRMLR
jgi:hypothetical protein